MKLHGAAGITYFLGELCDVGFCWIECWPLLDQMGHRRKAFLESLQGACVRELLRCCKKMSECLLSSAESPCSGLPFVKFFVTCLRENWISHLPVTWLFGSWCYCWLLRICIATVFCYVAICSTKSAQCRTILLNADSFRVDSFKSLRDLWTVFFKEETFAHRKHGIIEWMSKWKNLARDNRYEVIGNVLAWVCLIQLFCACCVWCACTTWLHNFSHLPTEKKIAELGPITLKWRMLLS